MNVLKPHLRTTIVTLLEAGASQREIARVAGFDRKTIRAYRRRWLAERAKSPTLASGTEDQNPPPRPEASEQALASGQEPASVQGPASACEPHREFITAQLALRRNYTAIYQDLVDRFGFTGAYNSVKRFAGKLQAREPDQFDRLEFAPGEECQVDYGEGALTRVAGTDRYRRPRLFVMTLRYSRRCFRRVVWKSSQQVWAQLHEQAWRYFGGSTQYVVLDNLKEGVIKPDLYEPRLNPVYAATLRHYGVVADPARVRDPNRKGAVENAIGHTQATALKGRRFESVEEQNEFLGKWEVNWAATRVHGSMRRVVETMFQEERPHLKALPVTGVEYFTEVKRTVCDDTCIRHDHSSYAARPARIGSQVLVRVFDRRLEIRDFGTQALLRTHARVERPGTVVLPNEERLFNPSRETHRILKQAQAIGPSALELCETLFGREGRVGQRKLWGVVGLVKRYPRRIVDQACQMALHDGIHGYNAIKTLTERLTAEALEHLESPLQNELALTQHHPLIRSGEDYADLFTLGAQQSANLTLTNKDCQ